MIFEVFKNEFIEFFRFLYEKNILASGIGFIIAMQINDLFKNILEDLVKPIATKAVSEDINKHYIELFGMRFKVGHLLVSIINFIITIFLIFYLYRITMKAPTIFDKFLGGITFSFDKVKKSISF
jgi:hypothetical protein